MKSKRKKLDLQQLISSSVWDGGLLSSSSSSSFFFEKKNKRSGGEREKSGRAERTRTFLSLFSSYL